MLHGKNFLLVNNKNNHIIRFELKDGLHQGAVSSPILFNIFMCDLLSIYGINENPKIKGIAFADDLIIYYSDKDLEKVKIELEKIFRNLISFFHTWKLKCNLEIADYFIQKN